MLIFPTNPTIDDTYQSGSSATYKWTGKFWVVSAPAQQGLTVATASYAERTAWVQSTPPGTGTGSLWYSTETGNTYINTGTAWAPATNGTINSVSASFAVSASALIGSTPTYVYTSNTSAQSLPNTAVTAVTGWTNSIAQNAGEWNASTGIFTATKSGVYTLTANLQFASTIWNAGGYAAIILQKNGSNYAFSYFFPLYAGTYTPPNMTVTSIVSLAPTDTLKISGYNASGNNTTLYNGGTNLTIQELPVKIQR